MYEEQEVRLKIQALTIKEQRRASTGDWLWDHSAFLVGYMHPEDAQLCFSNNDQGYRHLNYSGTLTKLVMLPNETEKSQVDNHTTLGALTCTKLTMHCAL